MSKTVLVTGGAIRLGRGISEYFLEQGWDVALHYHRSDEQARVLAKQDSVSLHPADLSTPAGRDGLVESVRDRYSSLDGLVNNAGVFWEAELGDVSEEDWAVPMEINARAPFELSRRLAPLLEVNNGAIVQITDAALGRPYEDHLPYFASKGALETLTRGLARTLGPSIRVNAVGPGPVEFPPDTDDKEKQAIIEKTVLERKGSREELARAVYFLLEEATYTTGEVLRVDGGRNLN